MAALSSIIRKSTSTLVPLALRTLRSQRNYHLFGFYLAKTTLGKNPSIRPLIPMFHYSSKSKNLGSDESLLRILDEEINSAEESEDHRRIDDIPDGFPFEIEESPGLEIISLKRRYQDEDIDVMVQMPNLVTDEGNDYDDADEESERALQSNVPLVVNMRRKGGSSWLEFVCTAYPDEIAIESLAVKNTENANDQIAYDGPDFNDLDENLQKSFHKYLEIRGIKPSTMNFLHEYMINKYNREYQLWLKKVKNFIQA